MAHLPCTLINGVARVSPCGMCEACKEKGYNRDTYGKLDRKVLLQEEAHWIATLAMHRAKNEAVNKGEPICLTEKGERLIVAACLIRLEAIDPGKWSVEVSRPTNATNSRYFQIKVSPR